MRPSKKPPLAYFGTYPARPSLSGPHPRGDELLDKLGWTIHYRELGGMLGWREFETDPSASDTSETTREAHNPRRSGGKVSFVIWGRAVGLAVHQGMILPSGDPIAMKVVGASLTELRSREPFAGRCVASPPDKDRSETQVGGPVPGGDSSREGLFMGLDLEEDTEEFARWWVGTSSSPSLSPFGRGFDLLLGL